MFIPLWCSVKHSIASYLSSLANHTNWWWCSGYHPSPSQWESRPSRMFSVSDYCGSGSVHHWVLVVTPIQAPGPPAAVMPSAETDGKPRMELRLRPHLILTWRQTQRLCSEKSSIDASSSCLYSIRTWITLTNFSLLVFSQKVQTLKVCDI